MKTGMISIHAIIVFIKRFISFGIIWTIAKLVYGEVFGKLRDYIILFWWVISLTTVSWIVFFCLVYLLILFFTLILLLFFNWLYFYENSKSLYFFDYALSVGFCILNNLVGILFFYWRFFCNSLRFWGSNNST